jgi:hypothetical protein
MKFLRYATGYSIFDKRRSEDVTEEFGILNLNNKIQKYGNGCPIHTEGMEQRRETKPTWEYRPRGRRSVS